MKSILSWRSSAKNETPLLFVREGAGDELNFLLDFHTEDDRYEYAYNARRAIQPLGNSTIAGFALR